MFMVLARYLVDIRTGTSRIQLAVAGEGELSTLCRILARTGYDFDVRSEQNQDSVPKEES